MSIAGEPLWFNERRIGEIKGKAAVLRVTNRHWFATGRGYSLDPRIVDELADRGIERIEFHNRESGRVDRIALAKFLEHAWRTPDFGYGRKLVCSSDYYEGAAPPPPAPPRQLGLFAQPDSSRAS